MNTQPPQQPSDKPVRPGSEPFQPPPRGPVPQPSQPFPPHYAQPLPPPGPHPQGPYAPPPRPARRPRRNLWIGAIAALLLVCCIGGIAAVANGNKSSSPSGGTGGTTPVAQVHTATPPSGTPLPTPTPTPNGVLEVFVPMGEAVIYVPREVHVTVRAFALLGEVKVLGEERNGIFVHLNEEAFPAEGIPGTPVPHLEIRLKTFLGSVKVIRVNGPVHALKDMIKDVAGQILLATFDAFKHHHGDKALPK